MHQLRIPEQSIMCELCAKSVTVCQCPICPVCGQAGNYRCVKEHGCSFSLPLGKPDTLERLAASQNAAEQYERRNAGRVERER
jgi:hypothetical protein